MPRPPSTKLGRIAASLDAVQIPPPVISRDESERVANVVPAGKRWEVRFSVRGRLKCLGRATSREKVVRFADFLADQRVMRERTPAYSYAQRQKDSRLPAFLALWEMLKPYLAENRVTLMKRVEELEQRVAKLEADSACFDSPSATLNPNYFKPVFVGPDHKIPPDAPPKVLATKTGLEGLI